MIDELFEDDIFNIPIKIDDYEHLFNELDYRELHERELRDDIDSFIDMSVLKGNKKLREIKFELIIYLPEAVKDDKKEEITKMGIINYYKSTLQYQKTLKKLGIKRIIYYAFSALILLISWYYVLKFKSESFISSLLNAGATVLLWEIMSLIFIERKNAKDRYIMDRKLSNMKIIFRYI